MNEPQPVAEAAASAGSTGFVVHRNGNDVEIQIDAPSRAAGITVACLVSALILIPNCFLLGVLAWMWMSARQDFDLRGATFAMGLTAICLWQTIAACGGSGARIAGARVQYSPSAAASSGVRRRRNRRAGTSGQSWISGVCRQPRRDSPAPSCCRFDRDAAPSCGCGFPANNLSPQKRWPTFSGTRSTAPRRPLPNPPCRIARATLHQMGRARRPPNSRFNTRPAHRSTGWPLASIRALQIGRTPGPTCR